MTDEKKHEQKYESLNLNLFTEVASDYKVNSHSKNVQEDKINVTERSDLEIYDNQYGFNVFEEKTNNEINMVISIDSDTDDHSTTAENVEGKNSDRLKQSLSSQTLSPDTPTGVDKIMENIDQLIQIKLAISEGNIPNDASSDEILDYVKADTMEMRKENNTTRRFQDVQEANTPEEGIHENQRLSILSVDSSADGDLVIDENTITVTEPSSSYETTENTIKLWDEMLGNRDTHYDRFISSCPEKLYLSCTRDTAAASNELAGTQNIHSRSGSFHSNDGKFELVGISGTCKITGSSSVTSDLFRSSGQESPQKDDSSDEIEDMCLDAIRRLSLSAPEHLSRHNSRDEFDKSTATPITTGTASPFMFSNEAQEALGDDELRYRFAFCSDNSGPTTDVESAYDRDIDMLSEEGCLDRDGILKEEDLRRAIFDAFHDLNCSHTHATSLQPGVTCDSLELVGDYDVVPTDNLPGGGNKNEGTGDPVKYHSSDDDCNFPLHHSNSKSYAPSNGILLDNERRHTLRSLLMNTPPVPILHPHASADHNTPDGDNINENASECNGTDLEMDAVDSISFTALKNHRANEASTGRLVSPKVEQETEEQPSFETNRNLNLHIQNIGEQIFPDDPDSCRDSAFYGSREDPSPDMPSLPTVTIDYFVSTDTSIQRMDGSSPDRDGSLIIEKEDLDSDNDLSMTPSISISSFLPSETQSVNIPFSMTSKFSTSPETHVTAASSLPEYNFAQHEGGINLQNVTKKKRNKKMSRRANSKTGNETNRVAASDASQIKSKQRTITRSTSTSKRKSSPVNRKCMLSLSQTNSQVLKINEKASAGRTSVSLASSRQLESRKSNCSPMVNSDHKITDINRKMKKKVPKQHKPNTLTFKPDDVKLRPSTRRGRDATKRRSWPPMMSDQSFKKVGLKRSLSFRDGINRINSLTNGYKDFVPLSPEKRDISRRAHSEGSVASSQLTIFRQSNKIGRLLESNRRHNENRITPRRTLRDRQPGEKYDKKAAKTQNLASLKKSTNARKIRKKDDQAQRKASSSTESFAKENLYSSEPSHVTKMSSKSSRSRSSRLYRSSCSEEGLRRQRNPSSSQDRSPTVRSRITSNSSAPSTKTPPNTRKPSIPRKSAPDFIQQNRIKSTRQKPIGAIRALGSNLQKASELSKLRRKIRAPEIKNYSSRKAHTFEESLKKNRSPVKPKIYKAMHKRPMSGSDDTLGEASPNLPWNRTQHNYQNKENNEATILNAAERAVIRIADERDKVQKKTFTKWINKHLVKTRRQVDNLYEDLRDGHNLIALLEVLSGETLPREGDYMNQMRLPREKGRMRFHRLQNVQIALDYLKKRKLRLVNIRNDDITDGNPKLTLGLVWTIILHFQIEDIAVEGEDDLSAKQALLLWAQRNMEGYDDIRVTNFTSSWRDGKVFNAILHRNRPDLIDMDQVRKSDNKSNLENAFSALEKEVAVTRLLDPEDVDVDKPDERSLITYVSSLYDAFPKVPPFPISITVEEWQFTWEEYRILVTSILEWIQKQIVILRRREGIPCQTVTEAKNLIHEIKLFQENELARKEADKNLVSPKYCDLEQMSQKSLGRFEIPAGYEPAKVEAAWQELMAANDEREGVLTAEYRRLEKLHNLVLKITSEASECRTKLEGAEKLIKIIETEGDDSDQMQKQVNALLGDSEKEIRVMFVDVQTLKDAEYHQADDMYKTVFLLHEKWVALRSTYTTALKDAPNVRSAILARLRPKLQDTKEYISLQGALRWVADKTRETESFPLGDDLPKVENQLAVFKALEDEVDKFNADVRECQKAKDAFDKGSEDCKRYCQDLSQLEVNYSLLQNAVEIREGQISSLLKFIREATQHLMWLNEIEDNEINRDFTQYTSDVEPLVKQLSRMKSDVQSHDTSFKSTIHDGERLVHENHPARNTVQAYLTQLNNQWEWIQSLGYCLQQHILQLNQYQQFHTDCGKAETFLRDRESDLDEKMREISPDTEPDRAEHIFRDIFFEFSQIKEDLEKFKPTVTNLIGRSKDIPCVEERPNPVIKDSKPTVQALCSYKQMNLSIAKSEECALLDKPQPTRWVVINSVQQQGEAPSAIFVIPPPSAKSISRAQALERDYLAFLELWRERHARVQLLVAINNLQRSIGYVSSWTIESYRLLSPIERDQALKNLKDGLKGIEDAESNDPTLTVKIASLRVEVQRCLKLAESLAKQMDQDDKDEEQCRTYISRLNVILRRLNTIDGVVSVRVKTALPRDVASVQHVINDHESSVVELKTIQPQYAEVREGSKQIMEREDCSAPSKEELGNQLGVVEKKWDRTWNISTLYFDKLKMVYVVVQSTKEAQNIVSGVETKIEENKEIPKDSDSLRKQQIIYQEMRDTLEKNHPLIVNLQRDAQKANEIGTKLVKVANTQDNKVTEDVDVQKYTADVKDVVDRWQVCKVFVDERLTKFSDLLPKAQQGEADEQRAKSLIDRLNKLLATLDSISTSQEAQMAVWLPRSVPALQQAEDSQGTVVKRVEDLKPEYDSAQTVVVNFINEETSGLAPSIPFLRDTLHKVQEKWAIVWLMTHVYFEKIKGLLYTQSAIIECEKAVSSYEKIISERSHSTTDVDALRKRNDIFQKLAADIPVHDSNFDALSKNLISTREVSHQLPPTIADKCNSDLEAYSNDIEDLQRRWEEAKSKLTMLADQVKIQLPKMEKAAAQERLLSDILSRIRALSRGLDSITQSQTARMQVSLPSEAMGLQKCQAQQKDVQNRLTDLSSDYEPLVSECNNVLEHGDLESPTATTVREECDKMTEKWILLNEITGLFYAKIKVLHDVSELMHDVNVVVVTYEQTLDANDHLPEKDLNALRKQQALLKALSDNIPTHEPKFPDVSETLEIAQATTKKLSEVSDIPEQDVPQRDRDFKDLEARWEEAKKRLQQRLILLGQRIPIMEKVASEESTAASLLPGVEAFIHELERLESAQLVRADVMLPSDVNAVSRVVQQQKTTIEHFVNDVTPRYAALLAQCRPLIEKENSTAPSVTELKKGVEKMENKWELVDHLVKSYLKKVNALLELLERLAVVRPILKTYESEVSKSRPNEKSSVEDLKACCATLQKLKSGVPVEDPKFDAVTKALKDAKDAVEKTDEGDQDIVAHEAECKEVAERWEKVKAELEIILAEVEARIPNAEKAASIEAKCKELLPSLKKLISELDSLEHAIRARIGMCMPAEPESVEKAIAQQKETSNRLDSLEPKYKQLSAEVEIILKSSDDETPSISQLKSEQKTVDKKWETVRYLSTLYIEKLDRLHDATEKARVARVTIRQYEIYLIELDTMSSDVPGLKNQVQLLEKLDKEIPQHEPEFKTLEGAVKDLRDCGDKLGKYSGIDDLDAPQYQDISDDLSQRWDEAKDQVKNRLNYARVAEAKLSEYEDKAAKQNDHLGKTENILNSEEYSKVKTTSKDIADQIKDHEGLSDDIDSQQSNMDSLVVLATEFDDAAKKYDDTAAKFEPRDAELAAKKKGTKTTTRIVVYEVTTITRKYDKLKNLISERVDRYSVDYDKAKDREDAAKREEEERNSKTTTITEITTTTTSKKKKSKKDILFDTAFRRQASLFDLDEAGCVSPETTEQLQLGNVTEEDVAPSLHQYLVGQQPISGIIVKKANNKKMSISEAMIRGIIMTGTGLALIEAQAGCGNIIDPHTGNMMTVDEAIKKGLAEKKYEDALQRAEKAVTGYPDPVTGKILSLYEAMNKKFVVESHGIRLLEAQIATGGLIDPRANHRVSIQVAYRRGLFDERMNAILEDPSDDTKGFFDPNTKKNHTYLELMSKSKVDPVTGVRCLEITRDDIDLKRVTMEITEIITTTTTKRKRRQDIRFKTAFRRKASLVDLFEAGLVTEEQMIGLEAGTIQEENVASQLQQYLFGGEEPIAGIIMEKTGEKLSINDAVRKTIIKRGTGIELLEAQAATGNIIDPKNASKLSVDEAAKSGLIDALHVDTLHRAERAVYGYKLPGTNTILSLFEAMKKGLVVESRGVRLLEAQIATGGLIDPRAAHRVPIAVAYERGLFDERMNQILEDPSDDTKGFFDPNTQENLSYLDLMERCITEEDTGLRFLVLKEKKSKRRSKKEESVKKEVTRERTKKDSPRKTVTTEERSEVDGKTSRKTKTVEKITVTHEMAKKTEPVTRDDITFKTGYRREAKLGDLVKTGVVSEEIATQLEHGTIKHSDVYDKIRRNLVGDEPIGGILVESTSEKLSINEAAKRGFLTRGTALQFLEAQAATGNIIDPKSGERLGVMDSYSSGLIDRLHIDPLERAERAVLGYKEKGSGNVLSLFECMRKGLVTETRGIRLLEAQIATGGLIDPRLNHRLPISVAYKQGIFDERMNEILEDPSDDTKGFFDPNSMKNSSYLDLVQKCIQDPKTGIKLLEVKGTGGQQTEGTGKTKNRKDIKFNTGFLRTASAIDLLEAGIITEETIIALERGLISEENVAASISMYLHGEQPIAGLILEATGEKLSILEAVQQGIIKRGTGLELLEAQAATGTIIDPRSGDRMSVTDAFGKGLVDNTQRDALERAQRAVTGYRDPITRHTLSLFEAMRKGYVTESRGIRLLEAQIATGGLIDPNAAHRVPISVAFRRGIFDKKMNDILEDPSDDTKGFFDPNTNANLTYLELMSRCQTEPDSGMVFLILKDKRSSKRSKSSSSSRKKRRTTQRTRKVIIVDPATGKELSVREAHKKGLIDSETAKQLMAQEGEWEETEGSSSKSKKVPPSEQAPIVDSQTGASITIDDAVDKSLVDKGTAAKFKLGEISVDELTSRLALLSHGINGPIGGIIDLKKGECITIAEAERRRLVDGTTSQRLLEAQAATGGIVNPANAARMTINDAISAGVIDKRAGQRIEKAEMAFRGFQDRRTKEICSLGEAMKKGLCYYDAGLRLLEYQYVTGGVVDPNNGSRISVDEAIERKWIDQRTSDRLTDLRRYARSIVDLKTNLLLTYPEALEQATLDSHTGLRVMEALPRIDRNARLAGGLTIRAGSMQSSLTSSLASSRAESPIGSPKRRGSFDDDTSPLTSPRK
uniref:plectin-like isoform X4 n=1 Tax=Styela clava TaxID=7725 RepID=UPI001939BC73|nr:plectin-like isoform X4 [Styela clava]